MLNIVIPMAGRGSRFANVGYKLPKPLIEIHGRPMIEYVTKNLTPRMPHRFIYLCLEEHIEKYHLADILERMAPGCVIVPVKSVTEGAACTVLLARQYIDNDDRLMIANSDQYVDIDINQYLKAQAGWDGFIMTMQADDPKWSFIAFDDLNCVTEVREKEVISNEATVGIYDFRRGHDFVRYAEDMIRKNLRVNGEFYVAPVYNQMIADGGKVGFYNIGTVENGMHGLGTPGDLEKFLEKPLSRKVFSPQKTGEGKDVVEKSGLLSFCRGRSRIFLYGAGDFGLFYAGILAARNVKVTAFIVTKEKPADTYCGLPVYTLDEIVDDLTERDGVVLSALVLWQGEMRTLIPNRIPVFGVSDQMSFQLQQIYFDEALYNGMKELFVKTNCLGKLRLGGDIWDNVFRVVASLCNENKDDPDLFFVNQPIRLRRSMIEKPRCAFPVKDVAVVIQGPICKENDFTIRTALFYRELYPAIPIIISTWKGEADEFFANECQFHKIVLLENDLPDNSGFGHVNYQMRSSFYGIQYVAKHTKAKFVLKCRTDQRINRKDFLLHFKNLLSLYPPAGNKLQARICFLDMSLSLYGPFHLPDYLSFGTVLDMKKLFDDRLSADEGDYINSHWRRFSQLCAPIDKISKSFAEKRYAGLTDFLYHNERVKRYGRWFYKFYSAEMFIVRSFFEKYIAPIEPERMVAQYVDFLKKYVICPYNVQVYWQKYDRDRLKCFHDGDYLTWLDFYMNYDADCALDGPI